MTIWGLTPFWMNLFVFGFIAFAGASGLRLGINRAPRERVDGDETYGPRDAWLGIGCILYGLLGIALNIYAVSAN